MDLFEQAAAQLVLFQQVAEAAHRRLVGDRLAPQVDVDEATHRQRVVEGLLERQVRQVEPVLEKVDAQHPLQADGGRPLPAFG